MVSLESTTAPQGLQDYVLNAVEPIPTWLSSPELSSRATNMDPQANKISAKPSNLTLPFAISNLYLNFLFLVLFLPLFVFYSFDYTVKSRGVCNRLPDLAYYPISLASALPSYVSDMFEMSHGLRS